MEAGAVELFAQLLSSSDQDIQFYCAAALSNLAVHGMDVGRQGVGHSKEGAKGGGKDGGKRWYIVMRGAKY